jgi:hypothetical protein
MELVSVRRVRRIALAALLAAIGPGTAYSAPKSRAVDAPGTALFPFWRWPVVSKSLPQPAQARPSTSTSCLPAAIRSALAEVQARFGAVTVVSTHRPGARIAGTRHASLHASCRAVDFRPARGTYGAVTSHLRAHWRGGIGTYSSGHIHIDVGDNYRWHNGGIRRTASR